MSELHPRREEEPPIGFMLPRGIRLLFTLILIPLALAALYFVAPNSRSVPGYSALAGVALTLLWWWDTSPDAKERHALRFPAAGAYGVGNLIMGMVSAAGSFIRAENVQTWVTNNIASGRLSYYVSAALFGFNLTKAACSRSVTRAGSWQYCIFAVALLDLGYGYSLEEPITLLGVLSWSIFFIIGDWSLIDRYVVAPKQVLATSHFLRIIAVNAVILFSWMIVMIHMWPPVHWIIYWFGVLNLLVLAVVLWCGSAASLAELTTSGPIEAARPAENSGGASDVHESSSAPIAVPNRSRL